VKQTTNPNYDMVVAKTIYRMAVFCFFIAQKIQKEHHRNKGVTRAREKLCSSRDKSLKSIVLKPDLVIDPVK